MSRVKISTKTGAVILIEGTEAEVSRIVSLLQELLKERKKNESGNKKKQEIREKRSTAPELILELREEGYFNKPKSLREIMDALQEKGYVFKITSLSGIMADLVKRRILGRRKINKKWRYGK